MTPLLDDATTRWLAERIRGETLFPGEAGYDEARTVWNGMIDRRPAVIVRCRSATDVMAAVDFARTRSLPLSVKGGGHSVAGNAVCDGGVMVDLSAMNSVQVTPEARRARVGPGARWGEFDQTAQAFGLATTGGIDSRTGVAGLTLGGGVGYLARKHGLAVDNLVAADVVTAAGELVRASEDEHPELFWGLRGGGGNFGIVTSFEFQLHPVGPEVLTAQIFYPVDQAGEILRAYRDLTAAAPDELALYALVTHVPPAAPFPETFHGQVALALLACYCGNLEAGEELLKPLRRLGSPIFRAIQPMEYTALQKSFDAAFPDGGRYYWKTQYLADLPDAAIDTIVEHAAVLPGAYTSMSIEPAGGAIGRVDPTATAFPHRNARFNFGIWPGWTDPADDEEAIAWARGFHESMTPWSTGGVYANYLDGDEQDRVAAAYGENHARLIRLKRTWDPDNLFQINQNVDPEG